MAKAATITIRVPAVLRAYCDGSSELEVSAESVRDREGLDTSLSPGDVVTILPAVSGG